MDAFASVQVYFAIRDKIPASIASAPKSVICGELVTLMGSDGITIVAYGKVVRNDGEWTRSMKVVKDRRAVVTLSEVLAMNYICPYRQ
jgi:hypothetical protein